MSRLWSYILPLPVESVDQLKVLLSVFSSEITIGILRNIKLSGKTYQKELLRSLPHSSRTVIGKLKQLVSAGVLREGVERKKIGRKTVWVKWYTPTFIGKWIITLLTPPEEVDPLRFAEISKELFKMYARSLAELCLNFDLSIEDYYDILDREYLDRASQARWGDEKEYDVLVFDTLTSNLCIRFNDLLRMERAERCSVRVGGSAVNVPLILKRLGVETAVVCKCGGDSAARKALDALLSKGVHPLRVIVLEDARTLSVLVLTDARGKARILPLDGDVSAILSSPSEVGWDLVDHCRLVYLGEVGSEVARLVSSYSKSRGKIVVYRPLMLYLRHSLDELREVLRHVDVFVVDPVSKARLGDDYKTMLGTSTSIVEITPNKRVKVCTEERAVELPLEVEVEDPYMCGDAFLAGLIKGLLEGMDVVEASSLGLDVVRMFACTEPR